MSMQWILKPHHLVVTCPDARKAAAVLGCVSGPMTPANPAAYLRTRPPALPAGPVLARWAPALAAPARLG
jgi:hypothetical protein